MQDSRGTTPRPVQLSDRPENKDEQQRSPWFRSDTQYEWQSLEF